MDKKVYDITNDDLGAIVFSLEKIQAAAISAHNYLDNSMDGAFEVDADKETTHFVENQVLCILSIIEDLTNTTHNQLGMVIDKLCKICREMKLQNEHTD
ncbi:MAG: hypothetical protein OSJ54_12600 [Oscillospiraceae bacterium]|nr:hypothetical protein [Oscillospiraceae bacterium]